MLLTTLILMAVVLSTSANVVPRPSTDQVRTDPDILEKYSQIFREDEFTRIGRGIPDMKKDPCKRT